MSIQFKYNFVKQQGKQKIQNNLMTLHKKNYSIAQNMANWIISLLFITGINWTFLETTSSINQLIYIIIQIHLINTSLAFISIRITWIHSYPVLCQTIYFVIVKQCLNVLNQCWFHNILQKWLIINKKGIVGVALNTKPRRVNPILAAEYQILDIIDQDSYRQGTLQVECN